MNNKEIAISLSKGERVRIDKIKDSEGVIEHLEAIKAQCTGVINQLKKMEAVK